MGILNHVVSADKLENKNIRFLYRVGSFREELFTSIFSCTVEGTLTIYINAYYVVQTDWDIGCKRNEIFAGIFARNIC